MPLLARLPFYTRDCGYGAWTLLGARTVSDNPRRTCKRVVSPLWARAMRPGTEHDGSAYF